MGTSPISPPFNSIRNISQSQSANNRERWKIAMLMLYIEESGDLEEKNHITQLKLRKTKFTRA